MINMLEMRKSETDSLLARSFSESKEVLSDEETAKKKVNNSKDSNQHTEHESYLH